MKLDSAIIKALSLDPAATQVQSHGGSGFSTTAKITSTINGEQKNYFLKTGQGKDAQTMFEGEHASLNAIHTVVPSLCPASLAHGSLADSTGSYLVTDFLDFTANPGSLKSTGPTLAAKLSTLHTTPAPLPPPPHPQTPHFGFRVPTACGSTIQPNTFRPSWPDFYIHNRLLPILALSESRHGSDPPLRALVQRTCDVVVPRLLSASHINGGRPITPVLVHGDLWSGNHGLASLSGPTGPVEDVIFDPSAVHAHSEYELGIMRMFGGFGKLFWTEYHAQCPIMEPRDEFEDRVKLYQLYHYLNHLAIFGAGYRGSAVGIMHGLLGRYGGEEKAKS